MVKLKTYVVKLWTYDYTDVKAKNEEDAIRQARELADDGKLESSQEYKYEEVIEQE